MERQAAGRARPGGRAGARRVGARRRLARYGALAASALLAAALPGGALLARPAGASPAPTYYLAVGASESVGYQPTPTDPHGQPTDQGYADDLATMVQGRWPGLQLVEVGCPGLTAVTAAQGGGRCSYPDGSELATAIAFLRAHAPDTVLATVDLGFNDLRGCMAHEAVDAACVTAALADVQRYLPGIVAQLQAAGGPALHLVGLEHNDPYLGDYLDGPAGQAFAAASRTVVDELNTTLGAVYTAAGVPVADVPAAFDTGDLHLVQSDGYGAVPADVDRICTLTWMCTGGATARDLHPDAAGYQVIAGAVASALGSPTRTTGAPS